MGPGGGAREAGAPVAAGLVEISAGILSSAALGADGTLWTSGMNRGALLQTREGSVSKPIGVSLPTRTPDR
jgi:hypothetical protein